MSDIPRPAPEQMGRDLAADLAYAERECVDWDTPTERDLATTAAAAIARARSAEAEVVRLRCELEGRDKALALMNKGMESQCDLMDAMKQKLRAAEALLRRLVAAWDGTGSLTAIVAEARGLLGEGAAPP